MVSLKEYGENSDRYLWGKVFLLKSEGFGEELFLCVKNPGENYYDKHKFISIKKYTCDVIFFSSVENDEVLEVYDSLDKYYSVEKKLNFEEIEKEIISDKKLKSEYQQASIVIIRDVFKKLGKL